MQFAFPWVLLLLPLAFLFLRRPKLNAIAVSSLAGWQSAATPRRVKWLPVLRLLRTVALTLLIIALAGPRAGQPVSEEIHNGIAINLLVDISSSMDRNITGSGAEKTSRLDAVKKVVESFIASRSDDLIGLITFARYADTLSPLTFGHDALTQLVQQIKIQDRPNEDGTAYGDALSIACAGLQQMEEWNAKKEVLASDPATQIQSKIIVLLTDGENNCGLHLPQEAAGFARQWGIRVYAISLGDRSAASSANESPESTDAEKLLERIAKETGAAYWKIYDTDALMAVYEEIDRLEKNEIKSVTFIHTEYTSIFSFFALPALLFLLIEQLLAATILRVAEEETQQSCLNDENRTTNVK